MTDNNSFFHRLKNGLSKTREQLYGKLENVFTMHLKVNEELFEELEEVLITSDVGVNSTLSIIENIRQRSKKENIKDSASVRNILKEEIINILRNDEGKENEDFFPAVYTVVGVNGVGKTTTIGKIAAKLKADNKKVIVAAGDTFRAAASEQLQVWCERVGVDIIKHKEGSDPAAVIFDGIQAAKARNAHVLICDTAGRLHNKKNLMEELKKIDRIIKREFSEARKETFLVVDATTGQNAVSQARTFKEAVEVTGIILTKMDGTAKGGVAIAIKKDINVPIRMIGVGEAIEDLQYFQAEDFVNALFQ